MLACGKGYMAMFCIRRWACSCVLLALALTSLPGLPASLLTVQSVRLTNGEWPPYTSETLPHGGLITRLVTAAFLEEGIEARYGYYPWKRAYKYGMSGEWDGALGWVPTEERRADYYFSEPVIYIDSALFHLKGVAFDWNTIDDLRGWRLGAAAGYSYGEQWDSAVRSGRLVVDEATDDATNLHKLLHSRVDAVAIQVDVAKYLMRQLTPQEAAQITRYPRLLDHTTSCLAVSRRQPGASELIARFNRGLQRLKDSGAYAAIIAETLHTEQAEAHRDASPVAVKR